MKVLGTKLSAVSSMLPVAGPFGVVLPLLAIVALVVAAVDLGMPGIEKALLAIGAFAAGVLFSRSLPIWRRAEPGELRLLAVAARFSPLHPWLRIVASVGWVKGTAIFLATCAALLLLAYATR